MIRKFNGGFLEAANNFSNGGRKFSIVAINKDPIQISLGYER
jgi:hypothetical protein